MVESLEKMISFVLALLAVLGYGRNTVDTSIQWRIFIQGEMVRPPSPPGLTVTFWTTFALFL